MLKFNNKKYVCHLDLAMDMIRGKWKAVLLCHLIDGLKILMSASYHRGISQKVLNENLLDLESNGLIHKKYTLKYQQGLSIVLPIKVWI